MICVISDLAMKKKKKKKKVAVSPNGQVEVKLTHRHVSLSATPHLSTAALFMESAGLRRRARAAAAAAVANGPPVVQVVPASAKSSSHEPATTTYFPSFSVAFVLLACVRVAGTLSFNLIIDCDESMNYWEPTHYMLYGSGLQTWEYSPEFAFRSYAYVGLHAAIGALVGAAWGADKIAVFHRTRIVLALLCALAEAVFVAGVTKRLGNRTGLYTLLGLAASAGMLHAAPSFLPSTFSMYGLLLAWGAWMLGGTGSVVAATVVALLLGWPFAIVALVPFGVHLLCTRPLAALVGHGVLWSALVLGVSALVDRAYYSRWLVAAWHIVLYNAFGVGGTGAGADIYGVEPWWFYARNMVLNFNVLALLAAASPLAVASAWLRWAREQPRRTKQQQLEARTSLGYLTVAVSQLWLWFWFMSARPHKEERFMFIAFPLVALASAVTLSEVVYLLNGLRWPFGAAKATPAPLPRLSPLSRAAVVLVFAVASAVSAARVGALVHFYSAPFHVWTALGRHIAAAPDYAFNLAALRTSGEEGPRLHSFGNPVRAWAGSDSAASASAAPGVRVCVGKEWYRFPASFFLPEFTRIGAAYAPAPGRAYAPGGPAELSFIKSGFGGLLPQHFLPPTEGGASAVRTGFNDRNVEEPSVYVPVGTCDYVVDFQLPTPRQQQEHAFLEPYFEDAASDACKCSVSGEGVPHGTRWRSILETPFLQSSSTGQMARSLLIPGYSARRGVYGVYKILRRESCECEQQQQQAPAASASDVLSDSSSGGEQR